MYGGGYSSYGSGYSSYGGMGSYGGGYGGLGRNYSTFTAIQEPAPRPIILKLKKGRSKIHRKTPVLFLLRRKNGVRVMVQNDGWASVDH